MLALFIGWFGVAKPEPFAITAAGFGSVLSRARPVLPGGFVVSLSPPTKCDKPNWSKASTLLSASESSLLPQSLCWPAPEAADSSGAVSAPGTDSTPRGFGGAEGLGFSSFETMAQREAKLGVTFATAFASTDFE